MICVLLCSLLKVVSVTATDASLSHVLQMEVNVCLCAYVDVRLHVTEKERLSEREQIVKKMSGWHMLARNTVSG